MNIDAVDAAAALFNLNHKLIAGVFAPLAQGVDSAEFLKSFAAGLGANGAEWLDVQNRYRAQQLQLWTRFFTPGGDALPGVAARAASDRRFAAPEWRKPYFEYLVESYLLASQWFMASIECAKLEPHAKKKLAFLARQLVDAASPANFPWSNPEALKLAAETCGESFAKGLANLARDMDKGIVSTNDESAFEVGRNLAITPGAVVFENDFMQLIQYSPVSATVYERPLVIVPPCINKYYILDLKPANSFVRHVVSEGHTVFMISWRNMPEAMGRASWDDYLAHGVVKAIELAAEICATGKVNTLGFCVGGTLLGSALAVLRAQGRDPAASVTLLAAMLDFSDTGALSVFVDEAYVRRREQDFRHGGILRGRELALTFASLRPNELIWNYVVSNYLKGRTPQAFDLLYWNADSTNLPGTMYTYYLRNMYLENRLRTPDALTMCGVPVNLARIDAPAYVLAAKEDHIVPWQTAYESARLLGGPVRFVLAASGHVAGVINPATANRRHYWLNGRLPRDSEKWAARAAQHPGSWWTHWSRWLARHGGARVAAPAWLGGGRYRAIEPAPGRYVRERTV